MRPLRGRKAVRITTAGFQPAVMMKSSLFEALVLSAKAEPLASSARFLGRAKRLRRWFSAAVFDALAYLELR